MKRDSSNHDNIRINKFLWFHKADILNLIRNRIIPSYKIEMLYGLGDSLQLWIKLIFLKKGLRRITLHLNDLRIHDF